MIAYGVVRVHEGKTFLRLDEMDALKETAAYKARQHNREEFETGYAQSHPIQYVVAVEILVHNPNQTWEVKP